MTMEKVKEKCGVDSTDIDLYCELISLSFSLSLSLSLSLSPSPVMPFQFVGHHYCLPPDLSSLCSPGSITYSYFHTDSDRHCACGTGP